MAQSQEGKALLIMGKTQAGEVFRPSDWAERLCGVLATVSQSKGGTLSGAMSFGAHASPVTVEGVKCALVKDSLREEEPRAWAFAHSFAKENDLISIDGLGERELIAQRNPKPAREKIESAPMEPILGLAVKTQI